MGALSACRSDAGTAAFVDNTRITADQVDATESAIPTEVLTSGQVPLNVARQVVIQDQTFLALMKQYAKDNKLGAPSVTSDELTVAGQSFNLNAAESQTNKWVQLVVNTAVWQNYLLSKTPTRPTTDADYKALYQELVTTGVLKSTVTFAQVQQTLQNEAPGFGNAVDLRAKLDAAAKTYDVSVNPRYLTTCTKAPCAGFEVPLLNIDDQQTQVSFKGVYVQLGGDATPAVLDLPTPAPSAAAAQ